MNALFTAAARGGSEDVVHALAAAASTGISDPVNCVDDQGRTPVHLAALHRNLPALRVLLTAPGVDLSLVDKEGCAPVHMAASAPEPGEQYNDPEALRLLVDVGGASLMQPTQDGLVVYQFAAAHGLSNIQSFLSSRSDYVPLVPGILDHADHGHRAVGVAQRVPSEGGWVGSSGSRGGLGLGSLGGPADRSGAVGVAGAVELGSGCDGGGIRDGEDGEDGGRDAEEADVDREIEELLSQGPPGRSLCTLTLRRPVPCLGSEVPVSPPDIVDLMAQDAESLDGDSASVQLTWRWLGTSRYGVQRFRVITSELEVEDKEVPFSPSRATYKTTIHGLTYNQNIQFAVCCDFTPASGRKDLLQHPYATVTHLVPSPIVKFAMGATRSESAVTCLVDVLMHPEVGGWPSMPVEVAARAINVTTDLSVAPLGHHPKAQHLARAFAGVQARLEPELALFAADAAMKSKPTVAGCEPPLTAPVFQGISHSLRLPTVPWYDLAPVGCCTCGARHPITPEDTSRGARMCLRLSYHPYSADVLVQRPRAPEFQWAVEPRCYSMLMGVPGIVGVFGVTTTDGNHRALVTQYHPHTLQTVLEESPPEALSLAWRLRVAERLVNVMAAVCRRGVVHGALRPSLIYVLNKEEDAAVDVAVSGFDGVGPYSADEHLYCAPEVLSSADGTCFGASADIWSLGLVIWELFSDGSGPAFGPFQQLPMSVFVEAVGKQANSPPRPPLAPTVVYSRLISPMLRVKPFTRPRLHALLQSFPTLDECNCLAKMELIMRSSLRAPE